VLTSHHPAVNSRATDPTKPPTWVDEFSQAMTSSDRRWSEADVLDVVAAAADLDAWLRDPRPYEGRFHRHGWESAVDDLDTAAGLIGSRLHAALRRDLTSALSATAGLPGSDQTPTRPAAQTALAALRARWTDPAVLETARSDIADACRDHRTPDATVAARRDLFWQLVRAADRNTTELGRLLAGILDDYALVVEMAHVRLGDLPNPGPGAWPRHDQPQGWANPSGSASASGCWPCSLCLRTTSSGSPSTALASTTPPRPSAPSASTTAPGCARPWNTTASAGASFRPS